MLRNLTLAAILASLLVAPAARAGKKDAPALPAAPKPGLDGREVTGLLDKHLDGALADVEEIVFAVRGRSREWHFFASTGYDCANPSNQYWSTGPGAMMALNLRTGKTRTIFSDPDGAVRYPCVSYDAKRILFSYRPGGETVYHLYEINADGTSLRQITDGAFDDVEPIYAPDGGIVFVSARCKRYVPCFRSQVQFLYRCEMDGTGLRPLSAGQENELTPWMLPDGRVAYMRWEYVERQVRTYHHLWTIRPDGTGEMVYMGNDSNSYVSAPGSVVITDPKPIPGSRKVVAVSGSRHGSAEYAGHVVVIDPREGPSAWENVAYLTSGPKGRDGGERWRDPYPFSEECFIVASGDSLFVLDGQSGNWEKIYTGQAMVHEPRPLVPRPREPVVASEVDLSRTTGTCILSQAHIGRNMQGLEPGTAVKLMMLEILPKPISGGVGRFRGNGSNLKRVLGTVPVEPDGSAHFEVPAMRAVMFVLLDENDRAIKRMRSFTTLMPGETASCVGCHEHRTYIKGHPSQKLMALQRGASSPVLPEGTPRYGIVDYPRDVQPILDKHCVKCHNERSDHGPNLSGGATPSDVIGYTALSRTTQLGGNVRGNDPPYKYGSGSSKLLEMLAGGHGKVKLSKAEMNVLRLWIDTGMWQHGTHAAMCLEGLGGYAASDDPFGSTRYRATLDADLLKRRCDSCHSPKKKPRNHLDRPQLDDENLNLSDIDKSRLLLAPLAKEAGGLGLCRRKDTQQPGEGAVFADKSDPDYIALRSQIERIREICYPGGFHWKSGYRSNPIYIREMKRYGVLPAEFDADSPIDPWLVDQRYYEQFYPETDK